MESRMRRKSHVRFGERDGANRVEQSAHGGTVPTLRDPTPSPEDVQCTRAIYQAGQLLGIDLIDHIIVGRSGWISLKTRGLGF